MRDTILAFRVWLAVALMVAGLGLALREWHFNLPYTLLAAALITMPWGCVCGRRPACTHGE